MKQEVEMHIEKAFANERLLKSLTGMRREEFEHLVILFEPMLKLSQKRKNRKRALGAGRPGILKNVREQLFFILFYLKVYPTYDVASFLFNADRAQPCRWVKKLLPLLEQTLKRVCVLPKRQIRSVTEFLRMFPDVKDLFMDGTEHRVQRSKNAKNQKRQYSGKKKTHTRKNIIITDSNKRIMLVSPTKNGRRHDKHLLDKSGWLSGIPPDKTLWVDTGFLGIEQNLDSNVTIMRPKKRSKNNPLTSQQKQENKTISSIRIVVENAIAGIKRFNSLSNVFRNRRGQDDLFFLIAAGLWNFHLQFVL